MSDNVAKKDLYIGFTKARNKGDVVSDEEAKQYGWTDDVEKKSAAPKKDTEK